MHETPLEDLARCVDDDLKDIGQVLVSLGSLSCWYGSNGASEITENKDLAHANFREMFFCDLLRVRFSLALSRRKPVRSLWSMMGIGGKQNRRFSFGDHTKLLSDALSFSFTEEAIRIGDDMLAALEHDLYYGVDATQTPWYSLGLFCKLKQVPLPLEKSSTGISDEHRTLLQVLESDDEAEFDAAVTEACEYHLLNSGEDTDDENMEFSDYIYTLFPSEITAAYRVRQLLNKPIVRNDHVLLKDYWEIDKVASVAQSNPLLSSIARKIADF